MKLHLVLPLLAAVAFTSPSPAQEPGKAGPVDQAAQVAAGAAVWEQQCARCHDFGRWRRGFEMYGGDVRERELAWHGRMDLLAHYVIHYMPFDRPNTLPDQNYQDVMAYLLDRVGWLPEGVILSPQTYDQIELPDYIALSQEAWQK